MKELLKKLQKFEIEIRRAVDTRMQGNFKSLFKGAGLEFDEVRNYQYGDDIRSIDWNVSSKGHGLFVKTYREDREQTVFFILDVSGSQLIGFDSFQKLNIAREICGVLTLSAIKEGAQVGLNAFSNKKEKYIKPGKGMIYAYQIISSIYNLKPQSIKTNLQAAFLFTLNVLKRKSVVIVISDFIDDSSYENSLKALALKHDVVLIHLYEEREENAPRVGIIPVYNPETGKRSWINTSSLKYASRVKDYFKLNKNSLEQFCFKNQITFLSLSTQTPYVPELVKLFKVKKASKMKS